MLEQVNLEVSLSKEEYKQRMDALKLKLYSVGHAVYETQTPVVLVFEGWSTSGKGDAIAEMTTRLDPRGFRVYPITAPLQHELRYPWLYRFWLKTPARGEISFFHSSWYRRVLVERVKGDVSKGELERAYGDIQEFERQLADDGVVIVKFWLQISKKEQKRRIQKLLELEETAWQVSENERLQQEQYKEFTNAAEDMLTRTEAGHAPWMIVPATDRRWARVRIIETVISRLEPQVATHELPLPDEVEQQLQAIGKQDGFALSAKSAAPAPAVKPTTA